jgi:hypothetical protein
MNEGRTIDDHIMIDVKEQQRKQQLQEENYPEERRNASSTTGLQVVDTCNDNIDHEDDHDFRNAPPTTSRTTSKARINNHGNIAAADGRSTMINDDSSNITPELEQRQHSGDYDNEKQEPDDGDEEEEVEDEDNDGFDCDAVPTPRLSSSTIPIVIDVSNRHRLNTGFYSSNDPLFQGVCLYSTSRATTIISSTTSSKRCDNESDDSSCFHDSSSSTATPTAAFPQSSSAVSSTSYAQPNGGESDRWFLPSSVFRFFVGNR